MLNIYSKQKAIGDNSENRVLDKLIKMNYRVLFRADPEEDFPYFDAIVMGESKIARIIEIKADTYKNDTVAIEYRQSGLDSALLLSTSNIYIIDKTALGEMFWIKTDDLKKYIRQNGLKGIVCNRGASECYLVPLSIFRKL